MKPTDLCPHCTTKYRDILERRHYGWLHSDPVMNPISRRESVKICKMCAHSEAFADYTGITDSMARTVVETDRQEAIRLPAGFPRWGASGWPTGGWDEYVKGCEERGLFEDDPYN